MKLSIRLFPDGNSVEIIRRRFLIKGTAVFETMGAGRASLNMEASGLSPGDEYLVFVVSVKNKAKVCEVGSAEVKEDGMLRYECVFKTGEENCVFSFESIKGVAAVKKAGADMSTAVCGFRGRWVQWRDLAKPYVLGHGEDTAVGATKRATKPVPENAGKRPVPILMYDEILETRGHCKHIVGQKKIEHAVWLTEFDLDKLKPKLQERVYRKAKMCFSSDQNPILARVSSGNMRLYLLALPSSYSIHNEEEHLASGFHAFLCWDKDEEKKEGSRGCWMTYI